MGEISKTQFKSGNLAVNFVVTVIKATNLPKPHKLADSLYCACVNVDHLEFKTARSRKGDKSPFWGEEFTFTADKSSRLKFRFSCVHVVRIGHDHVICESEDLVLFEQERNKDIVVNLHSTFPDSSSKQRLLTFRIKVDQSLEYGGKDKELEQIHLDNLDNIMRSLHTAHPGFQRMRHSWARLIISLGSFAKFCEKIASLDPQSKIAFGAVSFAVGVVVKTIEIDIKIDRLAGTMASLYDFFLDASPLHKILSFEKSAKRLVSQTTECAYFIAAYYSTESFVKRAALTPASDTELLIAEYEACFGELRIELVMGTTLQTAITSIRILEKVTKIEHLIYIDRLPYLRGASWNPRKVALRGTHDKLMDLIANWLVGGNEDPGYSQRIFLLSGEEGCGKSSVAHSIAQRFSEQDRLGCAIFLGPEVEGRNNSQIISSTIARNLAGFDEVIMERMNRPIYKDIGLPFAVIERQFQELIVFPTEGLTMVGPVVIVIDGINECEDPRERSRLLKVLTDSPVMNRLPHNFRFLITTRPEPDIENILRDIRICYTYRMGYDEFGSTENNAAMISRTLHEISGGESTIFNNYDVGTLQDQGVRRSLGVNLWASIFCKALKLCSADNELRRFIDILVSLPIHEKPDESIGQLYSSILQAVMANQPPTTRIGWHEVFYDLIQSRTDYSLALLTYSSPAITRLIKVLQDLGCIVDKANATTFARTRLHRTFEDFITDENRCTDTRLYVDIHFSSHPKLAEECLDVMNQTLAHNMCQLQDTTLFNTKIPNLKGRIEMYVPEALRYAARHWITHMLDEQIPSQSILNKLRTFLLQHLLHWIEILSVLGYLDMKVVLPSLELLDEWMKSRLPSSSEHVQMTRDAIRFIRNFGYPISNAYLHTYISALPQFPSNSFLYLTYRQEPIKERPSVSSNITEHASCLRVIEGHRAWVNWAAFSNDGSQIVTCSSDTTVRVWNAHTGKLVRGLQGHTGEVFHAVFSPSGMRVASCSDDMTVCVWDVQTGQLIYPPLNGHKLWVRWVEFSRDGSRLVTSSYDKDIRIWDASTGRPISEPLSGHKDYVTSAVFSPNGREIASSSWDHTVMIWDVHVGRGSGRTLTGHTDKVTCVSWSPNGSYIASASIDTTIRLWDAAKRIKLAVLNGHDGWVMSVSFSPDSEQLVSTAKDRTIRFWEVGPSPIHKLVQGGVDTITSANFSPDGRQVVSSSWDYSARVWDIHPDSATPLSPIRTTFFIESPIPTITFHGPFEALSSAKFVDKDGWVLTLDDRKIMWVPLRSHRLVYSSPMLGFLDERGKTTLVMKAQSPL